MDGGAPIGSARVSETQSEEAVWPIPDSTPGRPQSALHVWQIYLDEAGSRAAASVLSDDELARADRLRVPLARTRFRHARSALRHILAGYLEVEPAAITFEYGPAGKPELASPARLTFNVSHSGHLALCAVGEDEPVGVDVEAVRPLQDIDRLARRHFSQAEWQDWSVTRGDAALEAFFRTWTRKEALLKAAGLGLSRPLDRVDTLAGTLDDHAYWLVDVPPRCGYTGAVARASRPSTIEKWTWGAG